MSIDSLILIILALPLIGALINGTIGKNLPKTIVGGLATTFMFVAFALAVTIFMSLHETRVVIPEF